MEEAWERLGVKANCFNVKGGPEVKANRFNVKGRPQGAYLWTC